MEHGRVRAPRKQQAKGKRPNGPKFLVETGQQELWNEAKRGDGTRLASNRPERKGRRKNRKAEKKGKAA